MKTIMNNEDAIGLMIDEFDGNLSVEGKTELQKWISLNPANETMYHEFIKVKDKLDLLAVYKDLDSDISWKILVQKLEPDSGSEMLSVKPKYKNKIWWLSAAAIIICLVTITLYQSGDSSILTLNTLVNEKKTYTLPDGSLVIMNENTTIEYSGNGFGTNRELTLLSGEAFFDVVHDPEKIFQINMGNIRVTDIGTSFAVKRSDSEITVIVNSGRVAFEYLSSGNHVILDPGKKGIFMEGNKSVIDMPNPDINYKSWIDKKLTFRNTPLPDVVRELNKTYGAKVILKDNDLKKRMLSATLNYQTIDSVLLVISSSLQLRVHKVADEYILDYK